MGMDQVFGVQRIINRDLLLPQSGDVVELVTDPFYDGLRLRFMVRGRHIGDLLTLMHRFKWEVDAAIRQVERQYADERADEPLDR